MKFEMTLSAGALLLLILGTANAAGTALQTDLKDPPLAAHWIYDDLPKAMSEAKASGKPILVEMRCVPCPPGKKIDGEVTHPDADLEALESKFVCVRVIQTNGLDLRRFQYDYDLSVAFLFLNADGALYGRYGTRNGAKEHSEDFLSIASVRKSVERALALHAAYPANKEALEGKQGVTSTYAVPEEIPGLTSMPHTTVERESCIHCHMIKDALLRVKWSGRTLAPRDLYAYPLPDRIGLTMDVQDGLLVQSVAADSPAAKAGLVVGDELASINGQPLISIADIQWVLNGAPEETTLDVKAVRSGRLVEKKVALKGDWWRTDVGWRKSNHDLGSGAYFQAVTPENRAKHGIAPGELAIRTQYLEANRAAALSKAGLKVGDIFVAIDGKTTPMTDSEFLINLRLSHGPGETFKATIVRGTERQELTLPTW